jgi:hypothetical protein
MWRALSAAVFIGDPNWAWRRRVTFSGCAVFLAGVANAIWFDHDIAHASMVMTNCVAGFGATLAIYATLATGDDHLKRKADGGQA